MRFDGGRVDSQHLASMRERLIHRGPDADGLYTSPRGTAGLGFQRLKIIDLSDAANQPMANEDGSVLIVFNGEIYNFRLLRQELLSRGHRFRSLTDTEVIVHLYEEYGSECVERLDGMFAFALWDEERQKLVLARDRAGKKPLYYLADSKRLVFASEIKAFFGHSELRLDIDHRAIPYYFLYGYVPLPKTFYRNVQQVAPGTIVSVDKHGLTSTRTYWQLKYPSIESKESIDARAAATQVRSLMTSAVRKRMVSDVPVGAFLSGGIDSTIVVALMSQLSSQPIKTFSIGFKGSPDYDETAYARRVADEFETDHTEFIVEPASFDLVERLVWHHDGPFADSSAVPTYIVSQLTRREVAVVLTGDGGDELFGGYDRFSAALLAEKMPTYMRYMLGALGTRVPAGETPRHWRSRLNRFSRAASRTLEERLTSWSGVFYDDLETLIEPWLLQDIEPVDRLFYLRRFEDQCVGLSSLSRLLLVNFNTYLVDDLLVKTDRCTMANSLEARCTFLDSALVEYAALLPDAEKIHYGQTKVALRKAFRDVVPSEIVARKKMGFGIPFGVWFRSSLREALHDLLLAKNARYQEYVSASYVHRLVERHDASEADFGLPLWSLLSFELWLRSMPEWAKRHHGSASHLALRYDVSRALN
jgi:asparagine synthase (glutamine-hydrolysing)